MVREALSLHGQPDGGLGESRLSAALSGDGSEANGPDFSRTTEADDQTREAEGEVWCRPEAKPEPGLYESTKKSGVKQLMKRRLPVSRQLGNLGTTPEMYPPSHH